MSKLYAAIQTELVNPELETKIDIDVQAEPVFNDLPDNLYAAIVSNQPESTNLVVNANAEQFAYVVPHRLYSLIVPEKPAIIAEERIFVYVPKVTYHHAGIAKFEPAHFNIIDGKVSLKNPSNGGQGSSNLLVFDSLEIANAADLPEGTYAWIHVD